MTQHRDTHMGNPILYLVFQQGVRDVSDFIKADRLLECAGRSGHNNLKTLIIFLGS